jgi:asparagine synthase (glutamine-hydrolysing)
VAIRRLVDERLPREVARRPKQGFDPPLERWLRGDLRDLAGDALGGLDGPVDAAAAKELLARFQRGDAPGAAPRLYSLLMLSLWRSGLRQPRADAVRL